MRTQITGDLEFVPVIHQFRRLQLRHAPFASLESFSSSSLIVLRSPAMADQTPCIVSRTLMQGWVLSWTPLRSSCESVRAFRIDVHPVSLSMYLDS